MLKNNQQSYGWISILLHWLSAVAVIGLFALGWWMVELDYYHAWYKQGPDIHRSIGILLGIATLLRIIWKISQITPDSVGTPSEIKMAKLAHGVIYLLLFSLFISGYLISTADDRAIAVFNWFEVPALGELFGDQEDVAGAIHEYLAYSLIAMAALHALAALKHHFIDKDTTLLRMIKPLPENKQ